MQYSNSNIILCNVYCILNLMIIVHAFQMFHCNGKKSYVGWYNSNSNIVIPYKYK